MFLDAFREPLFELVKMHMVYSDPRIFNPRNESFRDDQEYIGIREIIYVELFRTSTKITKKPAARPV